SVASGATYALGASDTVLSISGAGSINLNSYTLTSGGSSDTAFAGVISGTGSVVKVGTGGLTLSGANTYSGGTTINGGTLTVNGSLSDSTSVSVASGATYALGASDTVLSISGAGSINLNSYTLTSGGSSDTAFTGVISGTGSVVKVGTGGLTLSGANTYSGGTTVNAGTLFGGAGSELITVFGSGPITVNSGSTLWLDRATLANDITLNNATLQGTNGFGEIFNGQITLTGNNTLVNYYYMTFNGVVTGSGSLTKTENGQLTLAGNNTYTGTTTISAGTVVVTHNNGLGSTVGGTIVASGAALDLYNVAVGAEPVTLAGGTLKDVTSSLAGDITLTANSTVSATNVGDTLTLSGVISGAYNLTKTGLGRVVLTGNNTYTGITTISAGTLALSGSGSIATSSKLVANGTFDISGTSSGADIKSLDGSGSVVLGSKTLNLTAANDAFAGVISGTGGLTLASGTQTLSGTNTYTGGTTINGGTLALGANNVLADSGDVTVAGGTFNIGAYSDVIDSLTINGGSFVSGSGGTLSVTELTTAGSTAIGLSANITSSGNQTWSSPIVLARSLLIKSTAGRINFNGSINAGTAKQYDLTVEAFTVIDLSAEVGLVQRISKLTLTAPLIYIRGDIATANEQEYNGDVLIGDLSGSENNTLFNQRVTNQWVGTDGYQSGDIKFVKSNTGSQLVRTFVSEDPAITFNGKVDDTIDNTHSIVVLAISGNTLIPQITFSDAIGSSSPLYSLTVKTMYYVPGQAAPSLDGNITMGGNVTTFANQTYGSTNFILNSPATSTLYTQSGRIKIDASAYQMTSSLKLDYTFANQPEISVAPGLSRAVDTVRDAPMDLGSGTLTASFRRNNALEMKASSDDDEVRGEVQVGDLENSSINKDALVCDVTIDDTCYVGE
ncbi:autotransporter-associated beta strand repeat-containing protein, partial [Polynucleobacter sp. MWH-Loch1C5]|uniref:beta strand repeat-containing protein n=1 Tax=Polynucleobacter sp. MWH-Loch1C5 TaxID=2689108 RepID=UPI001C0B7D9E